MREREGEYAMNRPEYRCIIRIELDIDNAEKALEIAKDVLAQLPNHSDFSIALEFQDDE